MRLIAASNRELSKAVADGILREDLYYRLNVIPIHMPPLRDRVEDIPLLIAHFVARITKDVGKSVRAISPESLAILERYHWPGNIRELENVVERAIVLGNGELLSPESLPAHVRAPRDERAVEVDIPPTGMDLEGTLTRIENRYIRLALERSGWLQIRAAELLCLSFRQLRYKLQKHGLRAGRGGPKLPVQSCGNWSVRDRGLSTRRTHRNVKSSICLPVLASRTAAHFLLCLLTAGTNKPDWRRKCSSSGTRSASRSAVSAASP